MEALLKRLQAIKDQIMRLKSSNQELQLSLQQKEKECARLRQLLDVQNSTIKELEQKNKIKRIVEEVSGEEESIESGSNRDLKFKVNEMIREVDKIISLLHQ